MCSPDLNQGYTKEVKVSLPELKPNKHKNYSPVYSFMNGILSLQPIPLSEAVAIVDDVTNHFADNLEGKKIKGVDRILSDIEQQVASAMGITVTHERVVKPRDSHEDEEVKSIYDLTYTSKRVLLEDEGIWLLMTGYRVTESGKIRPHLLDPHHPEKIEEKKNNWFQEALNQGYWILSVSNLLQKEVEIK